MPAEDAIDRRPWDAQDRAQPVRAPAPMPAQPQDPVHGVGWQGVPATVGPRGQILQALEAAASKASQPLVCGSPRYPHTLGRLCHWPAEITDALHDQEPAKRGEFRPSMDHESLLTVVGCTPQTVPGGSSFVNNLRGKYT